MYRWMTRLILLHKAILGHFMQKITNKACFGGFPSRKFIFHEKKLQTCYKCVQEDVFDPRTCCTSVSRALTNTVGGEYEYIHEYRVTNTNTVFALVFRSFKQNVIS